MVSGGDEVRRVPASMQSGQWLRRNVDADGLHDGITRTSRDADGASSRASSDAVARNEEARAARLAIDSACSCTFRGTSRTLWCGRIPE